VGVADGAAIRSQEKKEVKDAKAFANSSFTNTSS
jgi:hypothetical protein